MTNVVIILSSKEGNVCQEFDVPDNALGAAHVLAEILSQPAYSEPTKTFDAIVGFHWGQPLTKKQDCRYPAEAAREGFKEIFVSNMKLVENK